jgi:hypothetical protein
MRLKWRFFLLHASDRMLHANDGCLALVNAETMDDYFSLAQRRTRGDAPGIERYNRTIAVRNSTLTARSRSLLAWFLEPAP